MRGQRLVGAESTVLAWNQVAGDHHELGALYRKWWCIIHGSQEQLDDVGPSPRPLHSFHYTICVVIPLSSINVSRSLIPTFGRTVPPPPSPSVCGLHTAPSLGVLLHARMSFSSKPSTP